MLKSTNPRNGWGAYTISIIVLGFFGYTLWFATTHGLPKDDASVQQLVGAMIAALSAVLGFWIGSSRSSQAKDDTIAQQASNTQEALRATPPPLISPEPLAIHSPIERSAGTDLPPTTGSGVKPGPGTPVAAFLALAAISLALLLSGQPASAASQPARPPRDALTRSSEAATRPSHPPNCWGPLCVWPTPMPPSPTNIPDVGDTKSILRLASDNKAGLIDFLTKEDKEASTTVPGSNPERIWDPIAHMCLSGVGPAGPNHVQGLIEFVESLSGPAQLPPPIEGYPVDPEQIRLGIKVTNSVINAISSNGYPEPLRQSCGSLINDIALDIHDLGNNALTINALLMRVLPLVIK